MKWKLWTSQTEAVFLAVVHSHPELERMEEAWSSGEMVDIGTAIGCAILLTSTEASLGEGTASGMATSLAKGSYC